MNDDITVLKPFELTSYINRPYVFKSKQEFEKLVEDTKSENLDSLYKKVKQEWQKYIDAGNNHISLCAADTIFTYFQDNIGLTHYPFFVGGNTSGKSNNLLVFNFLGYQNMTTTAATICHFLSTGKNR
jgi:hypothetical protein